MLTQVCILCGLEKPLTDYYKHPMTANGHLGRCKECHKLENKKNRAAKVKEKRRYDRERGKMPHRKQAAYAKNKRKRRSTTGYSAAHKAVAQAVAKGAMVKPDHCQVCLIDCSPQAHHDDYSRPLEVLWVCPPCHAQRHLELGRLGKSKQL